MTYYFIDYENVNSKGISKLKNISSGDVVNIFYSDACPNLALNVLEKLNQMDVKVWVYGVGNGMKNALDFQLSSYLGYRIAKEPGSAYVIVSNDTGFNKVVEFWRNRNVNVSRIGMQNDNTSGKISDANEKKQLDQATREEMLKFLSDDEYSDQLLKIFNSYKTKTAINNGLVKELKDSAKVGVILKKLKPLLVEKGKK